MSSRPPLGPSRGVEKPRPLRGRNALALAAARAEAKSSNNSKDDRQATRTQPPFPTLPTEYAESSRVLAVGAGPSTVPVGDTEPGNTPGDNLQSHVNFHPDPFTVLIIDQSTTSVDQLPDWAHPAPRWDAVHRRTVSRRPPFFSPSTLTSRSAAAPCQPSSNISDNIVWITYPSHPDSPTQQRPNLRRVIIPDYISGTTPRERNKRIRKIDQLTDRALEIRKAGRASCSVTRSTCPVETRLIAWILRADRVNEMVPDLATTTVWVNPFRLLNNSFYNSWLKLFMAIYVLGEPS